MGFKKIEPNVWKPEEKGDEIEGVLIRVQESSQFGNKVYNLEVDEEGTLIQKVVFGTTVLDDRMAYVKEGAKIKIVFCGVQKNKKGQDTKIFEVWKDDESF